MGSRTTACHYIKSYKGIQSKRWGVNCQPVGAPEGVSDMTAGEVYIDSPFRIMFSTSNPQKSAPSRVHAKGVVLGETACFCLLSAFYNTPLLRTFLRTPVLTEILTRCLLRTLLRSTSFKEPSKNPSKKPVVA